jgi:hypothetical protein
MSTTDSDMSAEIMRRIMFLCGGHDDRWCDMMLSELKVLDTASYERGRREENEACARMVETFRMNQEAESIVIAIRSRLQPQQDEKKE